MTTLFRGFVCAKVLEIDPAIKRDRAKTARNLAIKGSFFIGFNLKGKFRGIKRRDEFFVNHKMSFNKKRLSAKIANSRTEEKKL